MTKQEIIKTIHNIRISHAAWASQEKVIIDAINLDQLIEPDDYLSSELYTWLDKNKKNLLCFSWYQEFKEIHAKLHHNYSKLFYATLRKYNPQTREELASDFKLLEADLLDFNNKIFDIDNQINAMSEVGYLDTVLKSNAEFRKNKVTDENDIEIDKSENNQYKPIYKTNLDETNDSDKAGLLSKIEAIDIDETDYKIVSVTDAEVEVETEDAVEETKTAEAEIEADLEEIKSEDEIETEKIKDEKIETTFESNNEALEKIDINEYLEETDNIPESLHDNTLTDKKSTLVGSSTESTIDAELMNNDHSDPKIIRKVLNAAGNLTKHISLKEQSLEQLLKEKELSELEFKHLEETENLSRQGLDQLHKNIALKKQEFELEHLDNLKLLELNTEERDKTQNILNDIEDNKTTLKNEIVELEHQNVEDQLNIEDFQQTTEIEKQFETLKRNKNIDLNSLEEHLALRKNDHEKLKKQLSLLEEDISEIEGELSSKKKSILEIEEKEQIKIVERSDELKGKENLINQRIETIKEKQNKLDQISNEVELARKELRDFNIHLEKINKTIEFSEKDNKAEITNLEQQQIRKKENLSITEENKAQKQHEVEEIQDKLKVVEKALKELQTDNIDANKELETAE